MLLPSEPCLCLCLVLDLVVLILSAYSILCLYDLDSDYLNSRECARKLNRLVVPLSACHATILLLLGLSGHYVIIAVPIVPAAWIASRLHAVSPADSGPFDPAAIRARPVLKKHIRECIALGAIHVVAFFLLMNALIGELSD